jgi:asparagine N-glycosylation enzyme membrane subunit Stt3
MSDPSILGLAAMPDPRLGLARPKRLDLTTMHFFFWKYRNSLIIVLKTYLFVLSYLSFNQIYFYLLYISFFYFGTLTIHILKIHSIFFLLISNFSEEIIYKIAQIKIVKRTISLLHIQYIFFLRHNVSIQKFKSFLLWSYILLFCIY